jgi:uridine kinase
MLADEEREDIKDRLDAVMESVLQTREERGYVPDRDEDKIAKILMKWEKSSYDEYQRLIESRQQFADPIKYQPTASRSETLKMFPQINRFRTQK